MASCKVETPGVRESVADMSNLRPISWEHAAQTTTTPSATNPTIRTKASGMHSPHAR
jgi:hypothetical protein